MTNQKEIEALIDEALNKQKQGAQTSLWDCLVLVGLTSINEGQHAAYLYKTALEATPTESRPLLWRRYVDALSEMLIVVGLPKTLNALYSMMPLVEKSDLDHLKKSDWETDTAARGWQYATLTHHDWAERYQEVALYAPDVAHITLNLSIEKLLSDYSVHDGLATMAMLLTVLVTMDCPLQASWYVDGYLRHGGNKETLCDIVEFAKKIAHDTDNEVPADFPSVEEMLGGTTS